MYKVDGHGQATKATAFNWAESKAIARASCWMSSPPRSTYLLEHSTAFIFSHKQRKHKPRAMPTVTEIRPPQLQPDAASCVYVGCSSQI